MPHSFIVGSTGSGKTQFVKRKLIPSFKAANVDIKVFDPMMTLWDLPKENCFCNAENFLSELASFRNCLVICDEAPKLYELDKKTMNSYLMTKRQHGVKIILIAQRYMNLPPDSRGNTTDICYSFHQTTNNSLAIKEDYHKIPELDKLKPLEYVAFNHYDCSTVRELILEE